jgi:hypothetical protein
MPRRRIAFSGHMLFAALLFIVVGWGVIAINPGPHRGLHYYGDSPSYLYAAETYAQGRGMRYLDASYERNPELYPPDTIMTAWAPGYPVLLMMFERAGVNVDSGALAANLLAFGAVGACAARAAKRYQLGGRLTICLLLSLLLNPGYLQAIQLLGTDMVFVGVCAIFLETLDSYSS